jgi:hypothetical protein
MPASWPARVAYLMQTHRRNCLICRYAPQTIVDATRSVLAQIEHPPSKCGTGTDLFHGSYGQCERVRDPKPQAFNECSRDDSIGVRGSVPTVNSTSGDSPSSANRPVPRGPTTEPENSRSFVSIKIQTEFDSPGVVGGLIEVTSGW